MIYPQVRRSDHTDDYHGTIVADPYRWLEDPDSEETQRFVEAENECTAKVFEKIPYRKEIQERMTKLYNYEKYSCPKKRAGKYLFYKNNGLQNQYVLYMQDSLDSPAQVLLDPNTLSEDGTAALSSTALSEGKVGNALYFAHGISRGGSDWQTVKVLNVGTKEYLPDSVQWVKFTSLAWMHDDSGFFYSRFPAPKGLENSDPESSESKIGTETDLNRDQQIWFHRLGTNQSEDQLIYAFPSHPTYYLNAEVTDDGQHLVIYLRDGCKNASMVHIADLSCFHSWLENRSSTETIIQVKKLVDNMDAAYEYLLNEGSEFYFQTNLDAPRERVIKCDISQEMTEWIEIIAEPNESAVLESAIPVGDNYLLVNLLEDVKNVLKLYTIAGDYKATIPQPSVGTVLVSARRFEDEYFFKFVSFLYPGTIFRHSVASFDASPVVYRETVIDGFDPSNYETQQVFYPSKDGTKIPMFLVGKKNIPLMGMNPVYLYGYGGFNIAIKPSFSIFRLVFVQHFGGLLAFPNLRGGSEYGESWHQQGTFGKKQNVFDDFQAAAEYLIREEYTAPSKIAIHGGSNGGLLVAACANQRPDLFACAVAAVGVMDMLRFHKFTCGMGWRSDYGDPDMAENFEYIYKYSPVHNVPTEGPYPNMLLTTGDHDDRVVPLHSYKLIAQVQHSLGTKVHESNPLLIRIETKAGHGAGKPTSKIIEEYADVYAFIAWSLGQRYRA